MSLVQVFRIPSPEETPLNFSFKQAAPVAFFRVDFFHSDMPQSDLQRYLWWKADITRFITEKTYYSHDNEYLILCGTNSFVMGNASKPLIDNGNPWQPIDTAPHEIEFRCLLSHKHSVVIGYWDGQGWRNERSAGLNYFPATHWKPLPDRPTDDDLTHKS